MNPTSTIEDSTQQLSLTEAGTQIDVHVEATTSSAGGDDDFGDFQMVEGATEAVTTAAVGNGMEVPQATTESSKGTVQEAGETQPSLSMNLADTTTNLQQTTPDPAAVTGTYVCITSYIHT